MFFGYTGGKKKAVSIFKSKEEDITFKIERDKEEDKILQVTLGNTGLEPQNIEAVECHIEGKCEKVNKL